MEAVDFEVLTGTKVVLRPIMASDTPLIVRWRNNPSVRKNFIFRETFTDDMHNYWLETKVRSREVVQYIIEERQTGQSVGSVYLRDINLVNCSAEYGIFIGEDTARGKGLGTETAKLFLDFAFGKLGLHRVSLRVLSGNVGAERSYLKAGFVREGVFRDMVKLDGVYYDVIFMAALASDRKAYTV